MIAFTTNIKSSSTAAFTNWNFNSFAEVNGYVLAANNHGLYKVGSKKDNGINIESYLEIGSTDFGIHNYKRLRSVYITLISDGDVELSITTDGNNERSYMVPVDSPGIVTVKVPCGRAQKGVSWSIKIGSVDGSNFKLMSIYAIPVVLIHGRR